MILGLDAGGTNLDAVLVGHDGVVESTKQPSDEGSLDDVLVSVVDGRSIDRVIVSTTRVLNTAVKGELPDCTNVLVPGVGLSPELAYAGDENLVAGGCIDHRGRITEHLSLEGVEPSDDVVSVTAKFSTRNPSLEREAREGIDAGTVFLGHESGGPLGFPKRAYTTVANAKSATVFDEFESSVESALEEAGVEAPTYYLKGDAAMLSSGSARTTPAQTLRSGPATSALGLVSLSGVQDAVCVDVGGTTTDVVAVEDGFPVLEEDVGVGNLKTFYDGVASVDAGVGGDTRVDDEKGLCIGERDGVAAAFGGPSPTPTDALVVLGEVESEGADAEAAFEAVGSVGEGEPEEVAQGIVEEFIGEIASATESLGRREDTVVLGGALADALAGRLADCLVWAEEVVVPEDAEVCGAVGCAVASVTVRTHVHVDTAKGGKTVASVGSKETEDVERGRIYDEDELVRLAREEAVEASSHAGAQDPDPEDAEILSSRSFNVVEKGRVVGQIADLDAQVKPGLRRLR